VAEAEAERARVEAERAATRAAELRRGQQHEEARVEDHVREADRVDPDVDHTAAHGTHETHDTRTTTTDGTTGTNQDVPPTSDPGTHRRTT
jgi:hypothetical protein